MTVRPPALPNGFDLRYNGDTTHTLTFNGAPVSLEWVRGLNARTMVMNMNAKWSSFRPIGRIVTGRQYTWQYLDKSPYIDSFDAEERTRFPGVELLAYIDGHLDLLVFINPQPFIYLNPTDDDEPSYYVAHAPILYQPSESTIALSNLNH